MISTQVTTPTMKLLDFLTLAAVFAFNTVALGLDVQYIALAVGSSLSGAIALAYLRRDPRKGEQIFKTLASSIAGIVIGAALDEYFGLTSKKYQAALFFLASLFSLALLQGLLSLTERNSAEICKEMLNRLLGIGLSDARQNKIVRRRKRRQSVEMSIVPPDDETKE